MALPKPENQPYVIIFRVRNKQKKWSENNLEIVCGVRPMMNDTSSTRKSTLCCNISITHTYTPLPPHTPPPYTHKNKNKTKQKQTNKQTKPIYLHILENNFEIVRGVRPINSSQLAKMKKSIPDMPLP